MNNDPVRVRRIDHINIRTARMEESTAFYERLLGLERTKPPGMDGMQAIWLCNGQAYPIIHINTPPPDEPQPSGENTGLLHHVAFDCAGYDDIVATLRAMDAPFETNFVASIGLRQIFVLDPNGVRLELSFTGA